MPATTAHPTSAALLAYGQGRLAAGEMSAIEAHLAECASCCEKLESTPDDTLLIRAREAATSGFRAREQTLAVKSALPREIPLPLRDHPRYRVLGLIGAGGMGAVYKAEHRKMERLVALKVINPAFVSSPAALERFEREVKTAAKLSHPNIVAAHDADAAGDLHFLVMEFVEGMSLDRFVASKGPLPPHVAANIIFHAAVGLQHAHEKGMIHRDIKPQNLMWVSRDGSIKILDFGLARLASQALQSHPDQEEAPERPADATRAGSLLGTPDYIAPEQATDAHLADIRADIYSLGCTLYFLLTGEPPFVGGSTLDKLHAHKTCMPTPIQLRRPEVSAELAAVLERMLAKDPANRYARPADLAKALKPIVQSRPATMPAASELKANVLPSPTIAAEPEQLPPLDSFQFDLTAATPMPAASKSLPTSRSSSQKNKAEVSPLLWIGAAVTAVLMVATCIWLITNAGKQDLGQQNNGQQLAKQQEELEKKKQLEKSAVIQTPPKSLQDNSPPKKGLTTTPPPRGPQKILLLLPQNDLFYPDFSHVRGGLPQQSVQLVTAAARAQTVRLSPLAPGEPVTPNRVIDDKLKADEFAAIVFVGAKSPELCSGIAGRHVKRLLDEFQADKKPICAICAGQHVPAFHGIFTAGTKVAGGQYVREHPDFKACAAEKLPFPPVIVDTDHRLITAQEYTDGGAFAGEIARMIGAKYP